MRSTTLPRRGEGLELKERSVGERGSRRGNADDEAGADLALEVRW